MNNSCRLSCIALMLCTLVSICSDVRITTYNIRREGSEASDFRLWNNRKEQVVSQITTIDPDILCLQEVTQTQLQYLTSQLNTQYTVLCTQGRGTAWGGMGTNEALPILFRISRFTVTASGTFRLNDLHTFTGHLKALFKPKKRGFLPRICTWAVLEDITKEHCLLILNTHLDNKFEQARTNMLCKISKQVISLKKKYSPGSIFLMGDFNSEISNTLQACIPQFIDTKDLCPQPTGPIHTHPGWDKDVNTNLDHIMLKGAKHITVTAHAVLDHSPTGLLISDHWPVAATITLN